MKIYKSTTFSHILEKKWIREMLAYSGQTYLISAVSVVASIVLVRLLSREVYGLYGLIFAIVGVITNICGLGIFTLANTLALKTQSVEEEDHVREYLTLGLSYAVLFSIFALGILIFFYDVHVVLYAAIATIGWFFYNLLPFTYASKVRNRHIKGFLWIEVATQLIKTLAPVLFMIVLLKTVFTFFLGYLLAALLVFCLYVFLYFREQIDRSFLPRRISWRLSSYKDLLIRGIGIAFESGAATFYSSFLLIFASRVNGLALTADVKVLLGFISTLSLIGSPLYKWIANHLPKKLAESADPWKDMMVYNGIGFILGIVIYAFGWIVGPYIFALLYGATYAHIWSEYSTAGLWLVFSSGAAGMSVFSRLHGLSWQFGMLSLLNALMGMLFLLVFHFRTLNQLSIFYGIWLLPVLLACYVRSYRYRYVYKKIRNV